MSDRAFIKALIIAGAVGLIVTAAHCAYIVYAYQHSSIIQFVAREIWL